MNKLFLLTGLVKMIVIGSLQFGYAQNRLPGINSVWKYGQFNCSNNSTSTFTYSVTGITSKNDTVYYTTSAFNRQGKYEFISINNKWLIKTDTGTFALFDYDANVGDTILLYRSDGINLYKVKYRVSKIDTLADSKLLKTTLKISGTVTGFHDISNNLLNEIEEIYLSRIGSVKSFIPMLPFLVFTCAEPFLCSYNDESLNYQLNTCDPPTKNIESIEFDYKNILTQKNDDITEYSIYDITGLQIYTDNEFEYFRKKIEIIPTGVYLIQFSNRKNYVKTIKLLK